MADVVVLEAAAAEYAAALRWYAERVAVAHGSREPTFWLGR